MSKTSDSSNPQADASSSAKNAFGLVMILIFFIVTGWMSYSNTAQIQNAAGETARTHETLLTLNNILIDMQNAETGQRGYVLTGDTKYLAPYTNAVAGIEEKIERFRLLTKDRPSYRAEIDSIQTNVNAKMNELAKTIELRTTQGFDASVALIRTDSGKQAMDSLRRSINNVRISEETARREKIAAIDVAYGKAVTSGILSCLLGIILAVVTFFALQRSLIARKRREWIRSGEAKLAAHILGNQTSEALSEKVLKFFMDYTGAVAGAFFIREGALFHRTATLGVPSANNVPESFGMNDGLLGDVAESKREFFVNDIPEGYLTFGSALGKNTPNNLIIVPAINDGETCAVFELGFMNPPDEKTRELLTALPDSIAVAIRAAQYRQHLHELLEETQRQTEELQTQSEELRVSNEELEEQGRALKESQTRLEQQQAELEQTNSQLEEQSRQLEIQRDNLARSNLEVQRKAEEVERASKYKSDFLANMSHELRTPLNSSLILSKLLADNPHGNLTADQVKFAKTIESAGNDLLNLINDILDLSKIEAGHMEIVLEPVRVSKIIDDVTRIFEPLAEKKSLSFAVDIDKKCPEIVTTDRQRLEQILKNLLSNAFKFTNKGGVTLSLGTSEGGFVFSVKDTGIGIPEDQQKAIFDAFRQADGTISRKYGGTGLGLSISKELTRLLGGTLRMESTYGQGSTFSVAIPVVSKAVQTATEPEMPEDTGAFDTSSTGKTSSPSPVSDDDLMDDRKTLTSGGRSILIVEDDRPFALILRDLSHEQGFKCIISESAEDGLLMARQYLPSAIILDVSLPDNTGLSVLDRLKRDTRTRHIPVHVVSASDYAQTALSMGAIGYATKPVKREDLVDVFSRFESKLPGNKRHVLVVEDDDVQRDSIAHLLAAKDVEIVGVGTAAECLDLLENSTFDCMVLDLSLPDASGYSLLEKLGSEDAYSFPPVIIYTGKDLSAKEEQLLRKYSKSIIIKGAKSPERLLDEVTLFLHQVVSDLPIEQQRMLDKARGRDEAIENRRVLIVEDDARNVYSLTNILEPRGVIVDVVYNGREALDFLEKSQNTDKAVDLILMDMMMPEMDGLTATREIRKRQEWKKIPVIMLTAKAMRNDQEQCLAAGASDYMAKPLDVEKLLSLVRVWMPR